MDRASIAQELGEAVDEVMSQKATSTELNKKADKTAVEAEVARVKSKVDKSIANMLSFNDKADDCSLLVLVETETYSVSGVIKDNALNAIANKKVTIGNKEVTTGYDGSFRVNLIGGTHSIVCKGFVSSSIEVSGDMDGVEVTLEKLPTYQVAFTIFDPYGDIVANKIVVSDDVSKTTNENGEVVFPEEYEGAHSYIIDGQKYDLNITKNENIDLEIEDTLPDTAIVISGNASDSDKPYYNSPLYEAVVEKLPSLASASKQITKAQALSATGDLSLNGKADIVDATAIKYLVNVTHTANYAFRGMTSLKRIVVNNLVGSLAFWNCGEIEFASIYKAKLIDTNGFISSTTFKTLIKTNDFTETTRLSFVGEVLRDRTKFKTSSKLTSLVRAFRQDSTLPNEVVISAGLDTSNVTAVNEMFAYNFNITKITFLGSVKFNKVTDFSNIFVMCVKLNEIEWNVEGISADIDFSSCPLIKSSVEKIISGLTHYASGSGTHTIKFSNVSKTNYGSSLATDLNNIGWTLA